MRVASVVVMMMSVVMRHIIPNKTSLTFKTESKN
jgi:hypothetical protein